MSSILAFVGPILLSFLLAAPAVSQGSTFLASRASDGAPSAGYSGGASLSEDGMVAAFHSSGDTLVAGDRNGLLDIFVHDRATGLTRRVSVSSSGVEANGESWDPSLSGDGRRVAFWSEASNLVPGDTNGRDDVFVHDLATATTVRASVSSAGLQANGASHAPKLSFDGRLLVFDSFASNLVAADGNGSMADVFVRDLLLGTTTLVSVSAAGAPASGWCQGPAISGDGLRVAFASPASNLVPGDTNGEIDVFVRDLVLGTTLLASRAPSGSPADGSSESASLSGDGRFVAFASAAANLVPGDTNAATDVFVHDTLTSATVRVSVGPAGAQSDGGGLRPSISRDGARVAFLSLAGDLVPGDTNGFVDVFVHDQRSSATSIASVSSSGAIGHDFSTYPAISGDGRRVGFESQADDLVALPLPGSRDVFVRELEGCGPTVAVFCTAGTTTHGCAASISAAGTPSAGAGAGFTISVAGVEGAGIGVVFYGIAGPSAVPFAGGSSLLCVQPPWQRTPARPTGGSAGACDGSLSVDWNTYVATQPAALGAPWPGGETVWAQAWFRDLAAPGGGGFSDALWFDVCR